MDQISNMLTIIKNGSLARKETVAFPYSKLKHAIAECLVKAGYVKSLAKKTRRGVAVVEVELIYAVDGTPRVHDIGRVSKPSRRVYSSAKELKPFKQGYGNNVLSTPKGIMTDKEARKELVGGEVLFNIW
jgi:small subunit ribosomal protein S8